MRPRWLTYTLCSAPQALPKRCRLILVGDANQLPSVGPGRVYRDLLFAEHLAKVTLSVVFRQAQESHIVTNAYQILSGAPLIEAPRSADAPLPDFFNVRAQNNAHAADLIEQLTLIVSQAVRGRTRDPDHHSYVSRSLRRRSAQP